MDFSIDTIKYNVRHLTAITPIFPGEGAIACLHEADTTHMLNGTLDYAYHVIYYRDTTQDTATDGEELLNYRIELGYPEPLDLTIDLNNAIDDAQ